MAALKDSFFFSIWTEKKGERNSSRFANNTCKQQLQASRKAKGITVSINLIFYSKKELIQNYIFLFLFQSTSVLSKNLRNLWIS